jgi:hypothetical protein
MGHLAAAVQIAQEIGDPNLRVYLDFVRQLLPDDDQGGPGEGG